MKKNNKIIVKTWKASIKSQILSNFRVRHQLLVFHGCLDFYFAVDIHINFNTTFFST